MQNFTNWNMSFFLLSFIKHIWFGQHFIPVKSIILINKFVFRSMSFDESLRRAKNISFQRRIQPAHRSDELLVPAVRGDWGDDCPLNPERIVKAVSGPIQHHEKKPDRASIRAFVNGVDPHKVNVPASLTHLNLFPAGLPVLDFYRAYAQKFDAWQFPGTSRTEEWSNNRNPSWQMPYKVEVKEVTIGQTSEMIAKQFANWVMRNSDRDQNEYPTAVISAKVLYIEVTEKDMARLSQARDN